MIAQLRSLLGVAVAFLSVQLVRWEGGGQRANTRLHVELQVWQRSQRRWEKEGKGLCDLGLLPCVDKQQQLLRGALRLLAGEPVGVFGSLGQHHFVREGLKS